MTIDVHTLLTAAVGICCGLLGWLGRQLWQAVDDMRKDLAALEVKISADYVRYDRLQDALAPLIKRLDDIAATLSNKADK